MTNFTETNEFSEAIPVVNLGIGNYEANKAINASLQAISNRTRFLKERVADGGGGFAFGGEFNATPTTSDVDAEFNELITCTIDAGALSPSASQTTPSNGLVLVTLLPPTVLKYKQGILC